MYTLLDNTASHFANAASVDRIGFVPAADPMNTVAAVEVTVDFAVVAAVEAYEVAEAAALAEVEAAAAAAAEAAEAEAAVLAEDQAWAEANNQVGVDDDDVALAAAMVVQAMGG